MCSTRLPSLGGGEIIDLLGGRSSAVGDTGGRLLGLAAAGGFQAPGRVAEGRHRLRTQAGQQRLYSLDREELKPVHDWVKPFERLWTHDSSIASSSGPNAELANNRNPQHLSILRKDNHECGC